MAENNLTPVFQQKSVAAFGRTVKVCYSDHTSNSTLPCDASQQWISRLQSLSYARRLLQAYYAHITFDSFNECKSYPKEKVKTQCWSNLRLLHSKIRLECLLRNRSACDNDLTALYSWKEKGNILFCFHHSLHKRWHLLIIALADHDTIW